MYQNNKGLVTYFLAVTVLIGALIIYFTYPVSKQTIEPGQSMQEDSPFDQIATLDNRRELVLCFQEKGEFVRIEWNIPAEIDSPINRLVLEGNKDILYPWLRSFSKFIDNLLKAEGVYSLENSCSESEISSL